MWKIILLCLLFFSVAKSQSSVFDKLLINKITSSEQVDVIAYKRKKSLSFLLFKFYKGFISSQDIPNVCHFHPSCSQYGLDAVGAKGAFTGTLATFDRLTRCNGRLQEKDYPFDYDKSKFIDPAE